MKNNRKIICYNTNSSFFVLFETLPAILFQWEVCELCVILSEEQFDSMANKIYTVEYLICISYMFRGQQEKHMYSNILILQRIPTLSIFLVQMQHFQSPLLI